MGISFEDLSDDELRDELTTWAGRVAAGEARLLTLVGELDERGAWALHGVRSCAHWLSWRVGMAPGTARERVRVARCLRELPVMSAAFGRGELSWSQVRALTRVATPADEERLVALARSSTGEQLERICRGIRRALKPVEDAQDPEQAAWQSRPRVTYDDDGLMRLTVCLPAEEGQVVLAALEQTLADLWGVPAGTPVVPAPRDAVEDVPAGTPVVPAPRDTGEDVPAGTPEPVTPPRSPTLADALLALCTRTRITDDKARARLKVVLDPLTGWARTADGELLPPGAVQHTLTAPETSLPLTRHDRGRDSREVPATLRALLGQVDGERCRFVGCRRTRHLHAHHVLYWSQGGRMDLSNLILLCSHCHQLVHREDYRLVLHPDRRLTISAAAGSLIPWRDRPLWRPVDELDPYGEITATTLPPQWDGSGLNLDHAVWSYLHRAAA